MDLRYLRCSHAHRVFERFKGTVDNLRWNTDGKRKMAKSHERITRAAWEESYCGPDMS